MAEAAGVAVIADRDNPGGFIVELDGTPQSYVDTTDPANLVFEYVRRIGHVVDLVADPHDPVTAVHLGGGGMTVPRYVAHTRPGSRQQVIEADRAVIDAVRRELPMPRGAQIRVRCADARNAATVLPAGMLGTVDLLVVDVFAGARTPAGLTTVEFFRSLLPLLAPGGVVAVNAADGGGLAFARALTATVAESLGPVTIVAEPGVLKGRRFGNLVLVTGPVDPIAFARRAASDPFPATVVGGAEAVRFPGGARPRTAATADDSPAPPQGLFRR
ncbi:spermidine synthase [Tsukamurella soli]|uniref:Fused MFS/spermidine synthase n=1 Tax=Tsukamurella soli TaxID=644556 RepID=A0ABP8K5J1_9ACTN